MSRPNIRGHLAAEMAARACQAGAAIAAAVALFWKGLPVALALAALAGLFYMARPGPSEDIDKATGRR